MKLMMSYRAFHELGQVKFADGGFILGSNRFTLPHQLPLKTMLDLKNAKIDSKVIISLCLSKRHTLFLTLRYRGKQFSCLQIQ